MIQMRPRLTPTHTPCHVDLAEIDHLPPSRLDLLKVSDCVICVDLTAVYHIYIDTIKSYNIPLDVKTFIFRVMVETIVIDNYPHYVELEELAYIVTYHAQFYTNANTDISHDDEYYEEIVYYASSVTELARRDIMTILNSNNISLDATMPAYWNTVVNKGIDSLTNMLVDDTMSVTLVLVTRKNYVSTTNFD